MATNIHPENYFPYKNDTYELIGLCMEVHRTMGSKLSEILYKDALEIELRNNGIAYEREKLFKVTYKSIVLPHHFKVDFVVEDKIILEVKAIKAILDEHYGYVINYLALSKCPVGLIVNFGPKSLETRRVIL